MTITPPTVHSNGTCHRELWEGYEAAYDAVRAAQDALRKVEFNARDYYVQGNEAYGKARDHRTEQFIKLVDIEEYLLQHLLSLRQQEK